MNSRMTSCSKLAVRQLLTAIEELTLQPRDPRVALLVALLLSLVTRLEDAQHVYSERVNVDVGKLLLFESSYIIDLFIHILPRP